MPAALIFFIGIRRTPPLDATAGWGSDSLCVGATEKNAPKMNAVCPGGAIIAGLCRFPHK